MNSGLSGLRADLQPLAVSNMVGTMKAIGISDNQLSQIIRLMPTPGAPLARRRGLASRNPGQMGEWMMCLVAILSGKGGVGKTTTCFGLALALQEMGVQAGILDLDLECPSVAGRDGVTGLTRENLSY